MATSKNNNGTNFLILGIVAVIAIAAIVALMQPEPTTGERIESAVGEMGDGMEDAAEELDPNRTTGEKVGDAIEDAGENVQDTFE